MKSLKYFIGGASVVLVLWSFDIKSDEYFVDKRDFNRYEITQINDLFWFKENLRFRSPSKNDTLIDDHCGVFYSFEDAQIACPSGWRLPTKSEVKALLKLNKKGKIQLVDTLRIELCGRIDYEKHAKPGLQNTFWLNETLESGHVTHWHTFSDKHELHSHDVINARRKFPVRCVCEMK